MNFFNKTNIYKIILRKLKVIHQNNLFTIVPTMYFDENHLKNYLNYTVKLYQQTFLLLII
ncbi:MAG: DUF3822 family protein [Polaribacter sp.]|nr:DUF3822 family protein [Polaribacter sp.]